MLSYTHDQRNIKYNHNKIYIFAQQIGNSIKYLQGYRILELSHSASGIINYIATLRETVYLVKLRITDLITQKVYS